MEKYQRVEKDKDVLPIKENEIRITAKGKMKNYITYALKLLTLVLLRSPAVAYVLVYVQALHLTLLSVLSMHHVICVSDVP